MKKIKMLSVLLILTVLVSTVGAFSPSHKEKGNSTENLTEIDSIISSCFEDFKEQNFSIIMIHPQDFADKNGNLDEEKFKKYTELLSKLNETKAESKTLRDLLVTNNQKPYI